MGNAQAKRKLLRRIAFHQRHGDLERHGDLARLTITS
jgi:hypothetical protein